jgi:hypothetical protein
VRNPLRKRKSATFVSTRDSARADEQCRRAARR